MTIKLLEKHKSSGTEFSGKIESVLGKMGAVLIMADHEDLKGFNIIVLRDDIKGLAKDTNLLNEMAKKATFKIKDINNENKIIYAEAEVIDSRTELIKELQNGNIKTMKAIIPSVNSFQKYGVFLSYQFKDENDLVPLLLPNDNFSAGPVRCMDVLSVGEEIEVEVDNISDSGKITVKAVTPYEIKNFETPESLESLLSEGTIATGIVVGIHTDRNYVRLASYKGIPVDAICGVNPELNLSKNVKVAYLIESVLEGDEDHPLKIRGRIIRVFKD